MRAEACMGQGCRCCRHRSSTLQPDNHGEPGIAMAAAEGKGNRRLSDALIANRRRRSGRRPARRGPPTGSGPRFLLGARFGHAFCSRRRGAHRLTRRRADAWLRVLAPAGTSSERCSVRVAKEEKKEKILEPYCGSRRAAHRLPRPDASRSSCIRSQE